MPPLHIQNIYVEVNKHLLHIKFTFVFNEKASEHFFIHSMSMSASSKQKQEHNNLVTI